METYESINGYANYEISNMGNIRNKKTGLILKRSLRNRYYCVGLSANGKSKHFLVLHRIIVI